MKQNKLEQLEPTEDIQEEISKFFSSLSFLKDTEDKE